MLTSAQNDKLALTFNRQGRRYINVGFDLSSIDVQGCGGPFGVAVPKMQVSLPNSPGGTVNFAQTVLSTTVLTGEAAPNGFTFNWTYVIASLDAQGATDNFVSVLFDLTQSGYGAFDNLSIIASDTPGIVDIDFDGITDDVDNCPSVSNANQANADGDALGDACDPQTCGNGVIESPETCDDSDTTGGDGCSGICQGANQAALPFAAGAASGSRGKTDRRQDGVPDMSYSLYRDRSALRAENQAAIEIESDSDTDSE